MKSVSFNGLFKKKDLSLVSTESIDPCDLKLIKLRVNMESLTNICRHHISAYTIKFHRDKQSKNCLNLFGDHNSGREFPKRTKTVSMDMCDLLKNKLPTLYVFPGQKFCKDCYVKLRSCSVEKLCKKYVSPPALTSETEDIATANCGNSTDISFNSPSHVLFLSNSVTSALDVTPVKLDNKNNKTIRSLNIQKTAEKVEKAFVNLHKPLISEITQEDNNSQYNEEDWKHLMNELKERLNYLKNKNAYADVLSTLTLVPISWSVEKSTTFFNITEHQVKR